MSNVMFTTDDAGRYHVRGLLQRSRVSGRFTLRPHQENWRRALKKKLATESLVQTACDLTELLPPPALGAPAPAVEVPLLQQTAEHLNLLKARLDAPSQRHRLERSLSPGRFAQGLLKPAARAVVEAALRGELDHLQDSRRVSQGSKPADTDHTPAPSRQRSSLIRPSSAPSSRTLNYYLMSIEKDASSDRQDTDVKDKNATLYTPINGADCKDGLVMHDDRSLPIEQERQGSDEVLIVRDPHSELPLPPTSRELKKRRAEHLAWLAYWGDINQLNDANERLNEELSNSEARATMLQGEVNWCREQLESAHRGARDMLDAMTSEEDRHQQMIHVERGRHARLLEDHLQMQLRMGEALRKEGVSEAKAARLSTELEEAQRNIKKKEELIEEQKITIANATEVQLSLIKQYTEAAAEDKATIAKLKEEVERLRANSAQSAGTIKRLESESKNLQAQLRVAQARTTHQFLRFYGRQLGQTTLQQLTLAARGQGGAIVQLATASTERDRAVRQKKKIAFYMMKVIAQRTIEDLSRIDIDAATGIPFSRRALPSAIHPVYKVPSVLKFSMPPGTEVELKLANRIAVSTNKPSIEAFRAAILGTIPKAMQLLEQTMNQLWREITRIIVPHPEGSPEGRLEQLHASAQRGCTELGQMLLTCSTEYLQGVNGLLDGEARAEEMNKALRQIELKSAQSIQGLEARLLSVSTSNGVLAMQLQTAQSELAFTKRLLTGPVKRASVKLERVIEPAQESQTGAQESLKASFLEGLSRDTEVSEEDKCKDYVRHVLSLCTRVDRIEDWLRAWEQARGKLVDSAPTQCPSDKETHATAEDTANSRKASGDSLEVQELRKLLSERDKELANVKDALEKIRAAAKVKESSLLDTIQSLRKEASASARASAVLHEEKVAAKAGATKQNDETPCRMSADSAYEARRIVRAGEAVHNAETPCRGASTQSHPSRQSPVAEGTNAPPLPETQASKYKTAGRSRSTSYTGPATQHPQSFIQRRLSAAAKWQGGHAGLQTAAVFGGARRSYALSEDYSSIAHYGRGSSLEKDTSLTFLSIKSLGS